jgi:hypothetical protein
MRGIWGEPEEHSTAAELYDEMLTSDIQRIKMDEEQEQQERMERLFVGLSRPREAEGIPDAQPPQKERRGFFGWLFRREPADR